MVIIIIIIIIIQIYCVGKMQNFWTLWNSELIILFITCKPRAAGIKRRAATPYSGAKFRREASKRRKFI
jgi:hypothetical protein